MNWQLFGWQFNAAYKEWDLEKARIMYPFAAAQPDRFSESKKIPPAGDCTGA
jgi:hypothetical protein